MMIWLGGRGVLTTEMTSTGERSIKERENDDVSFTHAGNRIYCSNFFLNSLFAARTLSCDLSTLRDLTFKSLKDVS